MSCNCKKSSSCNDCNPCNCCPPAPPCNPPVCKDPEPCDIALDSKCVIYTGGDLDCIGIKAGSPPIIKLDKILETIDDKICQTGLGIVYTEDSDCINIAGTGSSADPLVISTTISTDPLNIIECTDDGLFASVIANNGLTKIANAIKLGGTLINPTTIATDITNTLSITGLSVDATPDFILTQTTPGVIKKISSSTLATNVLNTLTANNGLTKAGTNIQLGGPLVQNTNVNLDTYSLTFRSGVSGQTGIQIIPGAVQDCIAAPPGNTYDWNTDVFNIWAKIQQNGKSWFKDNVGIGFAPESSNPNCGNNFALTVGKGINSFTNTYSAGRGATTSTLEMIGALGNDTSNGEITTALNGSLYFSSTTNTVLKNPTGALYSGASGRVTFTGANGGLKTSGGVIAGLASRALFTDFGGTKAPGDDGPDLEIYVGFQALAPQPYGGNTYTGVIDDIVGVQIEDQRGSGMGSSNADRLLGKGLVTNSWGVRQLGNLDRNYFVGNTGIGVQPNLATDTDPISPNENNSKLLVGRLSGFRIGNLTAASHSFLEHVLSGTETGDIYAGTLDRLIMNVPTGTLNMTNTQTSAVFGYTQFVSPNGKNLNNASAISGVTGRIYVTRGSIGSPAGGSINKVAAIRAHSPIPDAAAGYGGTIANAYGVYIDAQRDQLNGLNPSVTGTITNSFGIYQDGQTDKNIFKATYSAFPNMPEYANDAAADADVDLPTGGLYRITGSRTVYWKP